MGRREFCALACSIQPFVSDHARESYVGSTTSLEPDLQDGLHEWEP